MSMHAAKQLWRAITGGGANYEEARGNTDGMCSPDGIMPEVPVPGALCKQVGFNPNRCTYACGIASQCPSAAPADTCGTGTNTPPGWCGG